MQTTWPMVAFMKKRHPNKAAILQVQLQEVIVTFSSPPPNPGENKQKKHPRKIQERYNTPRHRTAQ